MDKIKFLAGMREKFISTAVKRDGQFQLGDHEIQQMFPTLKVHITGQGAQIIKKVLRTLSCVRSSLYLASSRSKTVWKRRPAD